MYSAPKTIKINQEDLTQSRKAANGDATIGEGFRKASVLTAGKDMISVGLIDATWLTKFPPELAARLKHLIDTPDA
jgi:hypothetical protein